MLIVLPFNSKDADLMRRNLAWSLELDSGCGRQGVLAYDRSVSADLLAQISTLAQQYFTHVHHCQYELPPVPGWPAAPNWAWQSTARWMFASPLRQRWFWHEADAIPISSGWFIKLEEADLKGGKSFAGHVVKDMGHMNGVGIYPWDVLRRNEMAMLARAAAWDVVLKPSTQNDITPLNSLIQHAWNVHPTDRTMIWNGDGAPVSFKSQADVDLYLDFNAVIIHRCKDGSLIPWLKERLDKQRLIMSTEYNVPQHVKYEDSIRPEKEVGKIAPTVSGGGPQIQAGVDQSNGEEIQNQNGQEAKTAGAVGADGGPQRVPKTEILIVTYGLPTLRPSKLVISDFDWLMWCLRSIRRHCTGFTGVTLAIPDRDAEMLKPIANEHAQAKSGIPLRIKMFNEPQGKGFLMHQVMIGSADELVPEGTEFVFHIDSDCIFHTPTTPLDYFENGKPVYLIRTWESLLDGKGVVSDCAQWRGPTEAQIGMPTPWYAMCRLGAVFPIGFYKNYRQHLEVVHAKPYRDYVLSGRNSFPQDRMDWTSMGSFAKHAWEKEIHWIDIGKDAPPRDRFMVYWSHGSITPEIQKQMEGFIK